MLAEFQAKSEAAVNNYHKQIPKELNETVSNLVPKVDANTQRQFKAQQEQLRVHSRAIQNLEKLVQELQANQENITSVTHGTRAIKHASNVPASLDLGKELE